MIFFKNITIEAKELVHTLKYLVIAAPYSIIRDAQMEALTKLGEILNETNSDKRSLDPERKKHGPQTPQIVFILQNISQEVDFQG